MKTQKNKNKTKNLGLTKEQEGVYKFLLSQLRSLIKGKQYDCEAAPFSIKYKIWWESDNRATIDVLRVSIPDKFMTPFLKKLNAGYDSISEDVRGTLCYQNFFEWGCFSDIKDKWKEYCKEIAEFIKTSDIFAKEVGQDWDDLFLEYCL